MKTERLSLMSVFFTLLIISSCVGRRLGELDPCVSTICHIRFSQIKFTAVDILFVVDNSHSMAEEQELLIDNFPAFIKKLTQEEPSVQDLHIGVVSTDLGAGGYQIPGCDRSDNGVLNYQVRLEDCRAQEATKKYVKELEEECKDLDKVINANKKFLSYKIGDNPDDLKRHFKCIAMLCVNGCGYEQPLEAALRALTLHAKDKNKGFLREKEKSLLAIIFITDEDDCSAYDPELFTHGYTTPEWAPGVRCAFQRGYLHNIDKYVNAFKRLRPKEHLVIAGIIAPPINPNDPLKPHPEIDPQTLNTNPELVPSCMSEKGGLAKAFDSTRVRQVLHKFGAQAIEHNLCSSDWTPALNGVAERIKEMISAGCLGESVEKYKCRDINNPKCKRNGGHIPDDQPVCTVTITDVNGQKREIFHKAKGGKGWRYIPPCDLEKGESPESTKGACSNCGKKETIEESKKYMHGQIQFDEGIIPPGSEVNIFCGCGDPEVTNRCH